MLKEGENMGKKDLNFIDAISINGFVFNALLNLLLNKKLITKDEFSNMLDEQCIKTQQLENADINKIKQLTELAKIK